MSMSVPVPQLVLFVDDEISILTSLKRMLHPLRHEMQCEFASSGTEALARLATERFDIVVADMRMPVMDGAKLLAEVQRLHPHIIRLALSGHADLGTAMRAVSVAHQFLAKPCDAKTLREVIMRAVRLRDLLDERELQAVAGGLRDIPARPENYVALSNRLADPNSKSSDIANLISRDVGVAANLLRIVNSAFFGLPRRVTSIESAIHYLGTAMLRSVVLANAVTTELGPRARECGYDLQLNETHALLSANLAMQFFSDKLAREDAFTAGLLQNVGELLLVAAGPKNALAAFNHATAVGMTLDAAERELQVVSHAQVGAYLLGAWGLPVNIVEAVAHHHQPHTVPHDAFELVDAVYAGALIADHVLHQRPGALELATARLELFGATSLLPRVMAAAERSNSPSEHKP